jgi:ankyrin repeat protein
MKVSVDVEYLSCPITQEIFKDPVVADDQIVYERDAIEDWFWKNNISPTTRERISRNLASCIFMQRIVGRAIEMYPELKDQQYNVSDSDRIATLINQGRVNEIKKYKRFNIIELRKNNSINILLEKRDTETMKYIIDHADDLHGILNGRKLIHIVCSYGIPDIIKQIIDKSVDLECPDESDWRPIHYICRYSTPEMIKYIIDKGVNLEVECSRKWRPIHFICRYSTPEMIKYIIDKGVNLETVSDIGWKPIHYICKYSTPDVIRYIIDKGVNLEDGIDDGWRAIHMICYYSDADTVRYIIEKGVDLSTRVKKFNNEAVDYNYVDLLERNEKMTDEEYDNLMITLTTINANG